ncbi:MAG: lysophospholipid acyltransferase family protein [Chlorobiaceae bacterium]|nr:lysophospholipid acyltransferase family protein [Chlorobiaceae bacterium]
MTDRSITSKQSSDRRIYKLFMLFSVFVRKMNRKTALFMADRLGDLIYDILKIRKPLVEGNLSITFPEKSVKEIRSIARRVYRNQARNFIEVLRLPLIAGREDAEKLFDINASQLSDTLQRSGVVLVSAHFGNWELLGFCAGIMITPLTIVVKRLRNDDVDRCINTWRTMKGNTVVKKSRALREGLKTLRNRGIMTFLADQSDPEGTFVTDFLGRPSSVFLGPAYLALKTRVPLFVCMAYRKEDGRHVVDIEQIPTDDLKDGREDFEELARRYTRAIDKAIRVRPEEWFWLHDRWKRTF